jgi:alanyl-tRNA synthetase
MKVRDIRQQFLDFFESKGHQIVASAPMVIKNDPTLMFTNAGMNQFKDIFLGNEPANHTRVADTQKCLRVSGKHNDLEEVGVDTYHHTMFEMLGNWSFGDYYKSEAIDWAWELLTKVYQINPEILYVTVFEGDEQEGLPADEEARAIWLRHVAPERILNGNKKDNFWEMGDTGPCGPCSEIHVDLRPDAERQASPGSDWVNKDHPLVVEIWNLVFMELNRSADGSLRPLPARHIDTGMGLERLAMALQNKTSNYDTDVFQPLIGQLEQITGMKYGRTDRKSDIAFRVISDHIRAIAFAIADGQLPSNTGAGYVIRRILRRAVRYAFSFLNLKEPFLFKLTATLCAEMGEVFQELNKQRQLIENVIREEEETFLRTLENGIVRIEHFLKSSDDAEMDGEMAFELYDTFGFPIDLTALILSEAGRSVDRAGFEAALEKQKQRSRAATGIEAADWVELHESGATLFTGYDTLESTVKLVRYRAVKVKKQQQYQLVFDQTPFYPEGGGQVGDTGTLSNSRETIKILDTKKENNLIIHLSDRLPVHHEEEYRAVVNSESRRLAAANHSATHLLHHALREVLGTHVEQKGSLVNADYLRFDFSHFSKMSDEELATIEEKVNRTIWSDLPLEEFRHIAKSEAEAMGAMALFGEKYGDTVRAIKFGDSVELCGGTHVPRLGHIGLFKIISESGIAAGVRRIEAYTNEGARNYLNNQEALLQELKAHLRNPQDPLKSLLELQEQNQQLQKAVEKAQRASAAGLKDEIKSTLEEINGIQFCARKADLDAAGAKDLCFQLRGEIENLFILLAGESDGKATLTLLISDNLVVEKGLNAAQLIRELARHIQGGGGGQPFFATAGGKNAGGIEASLRAAREIVSGI